MRKKQELEEKDLTQRKRRGDAESAEKREERREKRRRSRFLASLGMTTDMAFSEAG